MEQNSYCSPFKRDNEVRDRDKTFKMSLQVWDETKAFNISTRPRRFNWLPVYYKSLLICLICSISTILGSNSLNSAEVPLTNKQTNKRRETKTTWLKTTGGEIPAKLLISNNLYNFDPHDQSPSDVKFSYIWRYGYNLLQHTWCETEFNMATVAILNRWADFTNFDREVIINMYYKIDSIAYYLLPSGENVVLN